MNRSTGSSTTSTRSSSVAPQVNRSTGSSTTSTTTRSGSATTHVNRSTGTSSTSTTTRDINTGTVSRSTTTPTGTSGNSANTRSGGATTRGTTGTSGVTGSSSSTKGGSVGTGDVTRHSDSGSPKVTTTPSSMTEGRTIGISSTPTTKRGDDTTKRGGGTGKRGDGKGKPGDNGGKPGDNGGKPGGNGGKPGDGHGGNHGHGGGGGRPGFDSHNHFDYNGHHYGNDFHRNYHNHSWSWSRPLPPPARPYRPAPLVWYRPVIPAGWYPYAGAPVIDRILGISFGTLFDISLDYLYYNGYEIDGYADHIIYLRNVPLLHLVWDDVMLSYDSFDRLVNAQFVYMTSHYDTYRYNRIYNNLCRVYGTPITGNGAEISWYGGNSTGWVTLSRHNNLGYYYITLSIGY